MDAGCLAAVNTHMHGTASGSKKLLKTKSNLLPTAMKQGLDPVNNLNELRNRFFPESHLRI
jgi:hypothetical protein